MILTYVLCEKLNVICEKLKGQSHKSLDDKISIHKLCTCMWHIIVTNDHNEMGLTSWDDIRKWKACPSKLLCRIYTTTATQTESTNLDRF